MWMYTNNGNVPKKEGFYWCTLIADFVKNGVPTNQKVAYADSRYFGNVTNISEEYRMKDQPREGNGWTRDLDGFKSETVYAWSTENTNGVCEELPPGVIVIKRTEHDD